ncbi:MAG: OsmC family protein [Anaerolineales bacterium]
MADIKRVARVKWHGDLRTGKGRIDTESGVLADVAYSFRTRFEDEPGTNPEELIAAAHAACYSMAFANVLAERGYDPKAIETHATCSLSPLEGGGFEITGMRLVISGKVGGIDEETFRRIAYEADEECPVSNLLREGLQITLEPTLA